MTGLLVETNLPTSYISPSPSPDELVIQARGRRRLPVSWSPDIDTGRCMSRSEANKERTPGAGGGVVLRSTPRKRLLLNDPMELSPSPEKKRNMSPTAKKVRVDKPMSLFGGTLDIALKALSNDQLVSVIQTMVIKHPYLEEELKASLPAPDLRPLEERLHDLKRNIFKSLPNSRLTSKTDSPAYNRASTHVLAFKKCVVEQGRMLVSSQQWESVIDYVLEAWRQVAATPLWDNPPHNAARRHCFKFLAAQCMTALRRLHWPPERCNQLYTK
ncbi:hypothetical protein AAG570_008773 [Ranatra chinensis]|uniref:Tethering factor for nuclear proteasome STS1 n=1 Tax=Ranatra chinensis TaxID=642074 RepID=A0ABD0YSJ3_9HEMI